MLIRNVNVLNENGLDETDILISDDKILRIEKDIKSLPDEKIIEGKGLVAIPGSIEPHVHFRDFNQAHKEDFFTGSCAAAAGGVTTVLDMPNNSPPILDNKTLSQKREIAKKSIVNYGFYFGTDGKNISEIKKAKNIAGVKVYMDSTTGNLLVDSDEALEKIFQATKRIAVHAESSNVKKAIRLAKKFGNILYLCHISSKEEIDFITKEKTENIFAETTPHHLFLTKDDAVDSFRLVKPELKKKEDQRALWSGIKKGFIDTIGSDHAPHTLGEKYEPKPPYGVPGIETKLPLMLNAVAEERIELKKVVELCCENPARIFGLKHKGKLERGYDADIVLVDMNLEKKVRNDALFTKCKWSPFDGMKLKGWPVMTIVNGNIIFDNGEIKDIKGKEVLFT